MTLSARVKLVSLSIIFTLLLGACQPAAPSQSISQTATPSPLPVSTAAPRTAVPPPTARVVIGASATAPATITAQPPLPGGPVPPSGIRRVLIISVDGLRPDAISLAPMPNLLSLMKTSAYSLTARTIFPSATLPAHASMLTGLCPSKHGVDWNDYLPARGYALGTGLFALAKTAGLNTAMFVGKEKLRQITPPENTDVFRYINDRDVVIAQRITEEFPLDFGLMFVHFPTPDAMGHVYGWMTPQYISVVQRADEAIATVLKALDEHGLRQETLIIITADHGGHDQTHGSRMTEDMTIPWIVSGPGVHPGLLTTPVQTTDTAATAAWALGLTIPAEWDGWPVFEAFGQAALPRPVPFCK